MTGIGAAAEHVEHKTTVHKIGKAKRFAAIHRSYAQLSSMIGLIDVPAMQVGSFENKTAVRHRAPADLPQR
jgi:hypothetical protein